MSGISGHIVQWDTTPTPILTRITWDSATNVRILDTLKPIIHRRPAIRLSDLECGRGVWI